MSIEKGRISGVQFMLLVTGFIQGSGLLLAFAVSITKQDTWVSVLASAVLMIPMALVWAALAKRFPGKNLVEINRMIYGTFLGTFISGLYIYWILNVFSFNIRDLGDFYITFLMPETPLFFFLIGFTLVCAYTVGKGIEVMGRICPLLLFIIFLNIISTSLLLLRNMDPANFLPVFETPVKKLIQGTHIISTIPFGEMVIFLALTPVINNPKGIGKYMLVGLILGASGLLLVQVRNTAVLGITESILTSPSFEVARLIDVGKIFSRMDVVVGIGQTLGMFLKCMILYYATVISLAQLFNLKSYLPLILPIGGLAVILAATSRESPADLFSAVSSFVPFFFSPFVFIIPPLSLLVARLRNLPKKE
ncbi:MAG TPA: endospore germination permease [Bacillota bacterium]|nr:endospore germination permease [Bacillota bacterium]